jgi:Universal stress protein family
MVPPASRKRVHTLVTVGKPATEIVRVAREQDVDVILLGNGGRRGLRRLLRRTVIDKVRRKASIPVIAVDAHDHGLEEDPAGGGVPDKASMAVKPTFRGMSKSLPRKIWPTHGVVQTPPPQRAQRALTAVLKTQVMPRRAPSNTRVGPHDSRRARTINR